MNGNANGRASMEYLLEYCTEYFSPYYENAVEVADIMGGGGLPVKIGYITPQGEDLVLWYAPYPFKRMNMHVLEFSLSDAIANGGIRPELMESADEPMAESKWEL